MRHLIKIKNYIVGIFKQLSLLFKEQSKPVKILITALSILVIGLIVYSITVSKKSIEEEMVSLREVTVSQVSSLSGDSTSLPVIGTVSSVSEATIRAESSGKLTVYKKLGDYVSAGTMIASFENASERAAVLQAEGVYEAAKANRDIAQINTNSSSQSLSESKAQTINTINSIYSTLDDAIHTKTDSVFKNPESQINIKFLVTVPDTQLVTNIEDQRKAIEIMLSSRAARNLSLNENSDLVAELSKVYEETQLVKKYFDDLSLAYNKAVKDNNISQATIDANKSIVASLRTSITSLLSQIVSARTSLQANISSNQVAQKSGDTSGQASAADAQVKQALGALNGAQARLAKTIVSSPISGTINSLSPQNGDFVSNSSQIAVVSNNGALEIVAYVTEDDATQISVGDKAMIEGNIEGVITRVAPAIDPMTKKIEVKIGIINKNDKLTNGQSVNVQVTRINKNPTNKISEIKLPLSAIKLTPNGAFVFTVDASSTLISHPVKIGAILGEKIQILEGVTPEMNIVTDARGLKEGVTISVKGEIK
jgi:RND family efflux transporter MFP subunit